MTDSLRDQLQASLGTAYGIERELGGGGMSRVFLAAETALGRSVVVKVLPPETAAGVSIERFQREIVLAARLQHPHIVPLLTAGAMGGVPYFTMPFVEGESLRVRLARRGELPVAEAVRVLREIASALQYAHERGVVHRDIKPDNVLLSGGSAMVTDFGVAKALSASSNAEQSGMTSLGVALGTPAYMSPEQASADPAVDHRADVYAFGVLAYEVLTGQPPFGGRSPQGLLAAHVTEAPEPIAKRRGSLPAGLAALVMRCLEKRPADRPQSAAEIVHALDDLATPSGGMAPTSAVVARTTAAAAPSVTPPRRSSGLAATIAAVLALFAAGGFVTWRYLRADPATAAATATAMPRSIAVLPLENAGGDTTMQFFADGMTDELTTTVAKLPGLHVASRSAMAAALKGAAGDVKALGTRLGVGAVLEGRIRRSGNRMRLTAQLTNVTDGLLLWTESYDREVKDAFAVQDDVARAIAGALRVALGGGQARLATRGTTSTEAHDLYLRGRFLQAKYTEPEIRKSIELFQAALAKDPGYVTAWAGISESWGMLCDDFIAPHEALPKMREAIARGLALDSADAALLYERGQLAFYYDRHTFAAESLLARAHGALSTSGSGTLYYAYVLWSVGQRDSGAALMRHAVEQDPASPGVLIDAGSYFVMTGDTATARIDCDRLAELQPEPLCAARLAVLAGHPERAIDVLRRSAAVPDLRLALGPARMARPRPRRVGPHGRGEDAGDADGSRGERRDALRPRGPDRLDVGGAR